MTSKKIKTKVKNASKNPLDASSIHLPTYTRPSLPYDTRGYRSFEMLTAPEIKGIPLPRGLLFTPSPSPDPSTPRRKDPQYISLRILPRAAYVKGKYPITHTERNVFGTYPYSGRIKEMWKFKDEAVAYRSCVNIFGCFEEYRDVEDFVGYVSHFQRLH